MTTTTLGNFGSSLGAGYTVEFWVKTTESRLIRQLMGELNQSSSMGLVVDLNRNSLMGGEAGRTNFYLRATDGKALSAHTATTLYDGKWHHVAWVVTNPATNSVAVYLDGVAVGIATNTAQNPSSFANLQFPFMIGANNGRGTAVAHADATVDEVALYQAPLTAAKVAAHYNAAPRVDLHYRDYVAPSQTWLCGPPQTNNGVLGTTTAVEGSDPSPAYRGFGFDPTGGGDQITIARAPTMNFGNVGTGADFTVEMWVKPASLGSTPRVLADTRDGTNGWGFLTDAEGQLTLWLDPSVSAPFSLGGTGPVLRLNYLQHVVAVVDANSDGTGTASFYLDGSLGATGTWSGLSGTVDGTTDFRIGHQMSGSSWLPWDGEIGLFRVYATALSASDVLASFRQDHDYFVPEPGTLTLLALGLGTLAARRSRRR